MQTGVEERRKYKRVLFTVEDGIVGVFSPPDSQDIPITANVMNLSEGGLRWKTALKNNTC